MQHAHGSNMQPEDDHKLRNHPKQGPFQCGDFSSNQDISANYGSDLNSSVVKNGSPRRVGHSSGSQHELKSAYEQMKERVTELQLVNDSLQRRLNAATASGGGQNSSSQIMSTNHELEVNKAWEAYSMKCRECEKLRDELRSSEQKLEETQSMVRGQSHREDMLRAQSRQDEYIKKLQQAELEIRDHKSKKEMAREELLKEKEYLETVLQATKERHDEMETRIKSQETALQEKDLQLEELMKDIETQRQMVEDEVKKKEIALREKLHETEGKVLRERDERLLLESQVVQLEQWKKDMENFHVSSGLPLNIQQVEKRETNVENGSDCSDVDPAELVLELRSLTEEISALKQQASLHSSMLSRICEDPNIKESIVSLNCNGFNDKESAVGSMPVQCSEKIPLSQTSSAFPSMDPRVLVDQSPQSSGDFPPKSTRNEVLEVAPLAVLRQIHAADTSNTQHPRMDSPKQIEIPPVPENLHHAFNNIQIAKSSGDMHRANPSPSDADRSAPNYTAVLEPATTSGYQHESTRHPTKLQDNSIGSNSGTDSSNIDTLVNPVTMPTNHELRQLLPEAEDDVSVYYPPTNDQGQPFGAPSTQMKAVWPPRGGVDLTPHNLNPLWPPGASPSSSNNTSSFEPISRPVPVNSSSGYVNSPYHREPRPLEHEDFALGPNIREFAVQPVCRPISRKPPFHTNLNPPLRHPSSKAVSGARGGENPQTSTASSPRRQVDRRLPLGTQGQTDDRPLVTAVNPDCRSCPVCDVRFPSDATPSFMQRHINGHFSEEEDPTTID